jgi:DNA-binding winged helix-turn-helix (wHTH) protein/uncharacterized DUF497 family protein
VASPAQPARILRFDVFELDLAVDELRKNGRAIKLQGQPFCVLSILVQRAGEIVTREELREQLWPADTFVDFDHSLNNSILQIRSVLNDSVSSPKFIATVPRRGYRFLREVELVYNSSGKRAHRLPREQDPFCIAVQQYGQQLIETIYSFQELIELYYRVEGLLAEHPQHPDRHEVQLLLQAIRSAAEYASFERSERNAMLHQVSFVTASRIFEDPNALSKRRGFVDGAERWQTIGRIGTSVVLLVDHTVRKLGSEEVVRITGARKATAPERRFYEESIGQKE